LEYADDRQKFYRSFRDWDYPDWVIEKHWIPQEQIIKEQEKQQAENLKKLNEHLKKQKKIRVK